MVKPTGSEGLSIGRESNCAHISFVTVEKITYGLAGIDRPETYRGMTSWLPTTTLWPARAAK